MLSSCSDPVGCKATETGWHQYLRCLEIFQSLGLDKEILQAFWSESLDLVRGSETDSDKEHFEHLLKLRELLPALFDTWLDTKSLEGTLLLPSFTFEITLLKELYLTSQHSQHTPASETSTSPPRTIPGPSQDYPRRASANTQF